MSVVLRPRATVDVDNLMAVQLAYPGLLVQPRVEADSLAALPLLTWQCFNGRMIRNAFPAAGSQWTLALTLFVAGMADGNGLADTVYQNVHEMPDADPVPGLGYVDSVEDVSMFDRVGSANLPDKQVVQYSATFTVVVLPD